MLHNVYTYIYYINTHVFNVSVKDINSVRVIDFGNSIHNVHCEMSLYYKDFEVQSLLYRAPEVIPVLCQYCFCLYEV